jgi:5-amino-6-(5-phosphoribosylamino)uracil reductase
MRPKIICHMVSSIDGRLLVDRWTPPATGIDRDALRGHYDEVAARFNAQGWLVGRKSMEPFAKGAARASKIVASNLRETYIADRKGRDLAVSVDPHGKLHYGQDHAGGDHIVAVIGEHVSDQYLAELREDGVSYLFAGSKGEDLPRAMNTLGDAFGVETLLLEGGGLINGAFLNARLIDEISLLVYPGIDGLAGVPSIFEFVGGADDKPAAGRSLRHLATETLEGGMVWLRYAVENVVDG